MNRKKSHIQSVGLVECERVVPMCAVAALPVMVILVEERLKLL